jgi:hypothetical protein
MELEHPYYGAAASAGGPHPTRGAYMSLYRSLALAVVCAITLGSSAALAFTAGVEVGAMGASSQGLPAGTNTDASSGTFGVILEQPFHLIPILQFEFFEDFQTPFYLQTGATNGAQYWGIDIGARLGLDLGLLIPYVGFVGQALILSSTPSGSPPLNGNAWALGGDLGLDLSLVIFKIGLELRYLGTVSQLAQSSNVPSSAQELELLGSVRISF